MRKERTVPVRADATGTAPTGTGSYVAVVHLAWDSEVLSWSVIHERSIIRPTTIRLPTPVLSWYYPTNSVYVTID